MTPPVELDIHDLAEPLPRGTTLIEASAGTGKTYTIAAIFLRLLVEHGLAVNQILVTTFTRPATAELRDRIRRLLREAAEALEGGETENPLLLALRERAGEQAGAEGRRLREALRGFDEAAIDTIHSFCQRVLTRYAFESGAAADPELLTDESDLLHQVACDYWRSRFYECTECHAAAAHAHPVSVSTLSGLLREYLQQPTAEVRPAASATELAASQQALLATMAALRACWARGSAEVRAHFSTANAWAKSPYNKAGEMEALLAGVSVCLAENDAPLTAFASLLAYRATALAEGTKVRQTTPAHEFFDLCEQLQGDVARHALAVEADFLAWAPEELRRRKERANLLSYGDLLSRLSRELQGARGPELIGRLRQQYRAALIDEFQDTDPLQDGIFERLFGHGAEGWLFLIGDPKQAIFGFRGGDIFTYLRAAGRAGRSLTLGTNFRSTTALVGGTNAVFGQGPRAFVLPGIQFHPVRAAGRADAATFADASGTGPLRMWVWDEAAELPTRKEEIEERLAEAAAGEIARLLAGEGRLGEERLLPSHIAILTSTNQQAWAMQEKLRRFRIPSALLSSASVFASGEAAELLTILHAVSQPREEPRARAALLTDVFGLAMAAVQALGEEARAWEEWSARFHEWHELWSSRGFIAMWRRLLSDLGAAPRLLAYLDGERRLTNFRHLAELLQRAATEEQLTPVATVKWLGAQMAADRAEEETELRLERDDRAVRIVTVHKSKGLEYDLVFCPFAWKSCSSGKKGRLRFHEPDGTAVLDLRPAATSPELGRAQQEKMAEEVRLLYVALTRARHRCDLAIGPFPSAAVSASNWLLQPPLPPERLAAASSGDWHAALGEHYGALTGPDWRASVAALAAAAAPSISVVPVPSAEGPRYQPATPPRRRQPARIFTGKIENDFAVSSFSSLTRGASADAPERAAPPWLEDAARAVPVADDLHSLPAGASTGNCLHEIFEELDFQDPSGHEALIQQKLTAAGFEVDRWWPTMQRGVQAALAARLPGDFRLLDLPSAQRLVECEFHLPVRLLDAATLQRLVGEAGGGPAPLRAPPGLAQGLH